MNNKAIAKKKLFELTLDIAKEHDLTEKEHDILTCFCMGMVQQEIVSEVGVTTRTVTETQRKLGDKFNLDGNATIHKILSYVMKRLLEKVKQWNG